MLAALLDHMARGARLAAVIAVALVAGFLVATAAGVPGPSNLVAVVSGGQGDATETPSAEATGQPETSEPVETGQPDETGKPAKSAKPEKTGQPGKTGDTAGGTEPGGVHGSCVSKVARDRNTVGGPHHNHGWAVSRAAHSCPHPSSAATDD